MATILSIVSYKIFPAKLGGQKGIALFNEYLAKETALVCATVKTNDPVFAKGYTVLNVLSNSPLRYINPFYFFTIRRIIKKYRVTHLLLEHPYYGWLGILLKWFAGVKLVVHSHNIESARWKSLGKWWWIILWQYEKCTHRIANYSFFIQDEDRDFAIRNFKLDASKCIAVTYGIEWEHPPVREEKNNCKLILRKQHGIGEDETILLFNGTLNYKPNLDAVQIILEKINPLLLNSGLAYKIIICGRGLPADMNELKDYTDRNIIYAGFVDDITVYFKGADIFINPVLDGGGIKTKLVEALGYNTAVVSTVSGSIGVTQHDGRQLLKITADNDWPLFAAAVTALSQSAAPEIPDSFYQKFYWGNIARKAAAFIEG